MSLASATVEEMPMTIGWNRLGLALFVLLLSAPAGNRPCAVFGVIPAGRIECEEIVRPFEPWPVGRRLFARKS